MTNQGDYRRGTHVVPALHARLVFVTAAAAAHPAARCSPGAGKSHGGCAHTPVPGCASSIARTIWCACRPGTRRR